MRNKIVAGNWKMNKTSEEAKALTSEVVAMAAGEVSNAATIVLCVPFPYLSMVKAQLGDHSRIAIGAQNCSEHELGAFTGEVSAMMLNSTGTRYVIIGHSERRQYFGEGGKLLARKIDRVLAQRMTPIFCCGETLDVREKGNHIGLVTQQVDEALFHLDGDVVKSVVIAYEPVWAIGTGKTATSEQAQEMHSVIRRHLGRKYSPDVAGAVSILYGGSVKPDNAAELFSCPDVDGGLVGGASLKSRDFIDIVKGIEQ